MGIFDKEFHLCPDVLEYTTHCVNLREVYTSSLF